MISQLDSSDLIAALFVIGMGIIAYRIIVPTDEYYRRLDIDREFEIAAENKKKRQRRPRSAKLKDGTFNKE